MAKKTKEKDLKIYNFLLERKTSGIMPTVREICASCGINSTSVVHNALRRLESEGLILRDANSSRSITISSAASTVDVPIMGKVTAGQPILAIEQIEKYIPLPSQLGSKDGLFALRVSGLSMKDVGILDGDIIIANRLLPPQNGDIIVALIGEEATVKRLKFINNKPVLMPENPDFSPIYPESLVSLGKVVGCYREY